MFSERELTQSLGIDKTLLAHLPHLKANSYGGKRCCWRPETRCMLADGALSAFLFATMTMRAKSCVSCCKQIWALCLLDGALLLAA